MSSVSLPSAGVATGPVQHLDYRVKLLYGIGGIPNAVKTILFGLFTLYFYTSVMGLSGTLVGIASAIGLVWDAVIDPYIGYFSDRARFRFGRRHTFMLVGALTTGVSFWAFFSPPQGLSTAARFAWLLGTSLLVRTAISVYLIPYLALGAELSQDYHERTSITGLRGLMGLLGTLVAASLVFVVFFPEQTAGTDPKLNYAGYPAMGRTFGLAMTLIGLVATFGTLQWRSQSAPGDLQFAAPSLQPAAFLKDFAQSLRNPSFRVLFASFSLFFLGVVVNSLLFIHYLTYYAKITTSTDLSSFQFLFYVGGLIGIVVWLRVSRRIEKHWLYILGMMATAMLMLAALLLVGEGRLFGTGNAGVLRFGHALGGFFGSVLWFMPASMLADVADEDELATGQRREGSFFGILSFGEQLAGGASLLATGVLVDRFAGLVPGQAVQSAQTVWRIGVLYSVLPAVLLGIAAALVVRYELSRQRVVAIRIELQRVTDSTTADRGT